MEKNYLDPPYEILEKKINYTFKNRQLLIKALTHRSKQIDHNERLEFLGDSILNFVIADALYQKLPHAKEGDLSRYRARLVCEESLAEIALEFQLSNFLLLGVGELRTGGFRRKSIMADSLEALIAAIYLDSDLPNCQKIVENWFHQKVTQSIQEKIKKDPKSMLQEYLQSHQLSLPIYKIIKISGADHDQTFYISCKLADLNLETEGKGSSRRIAEQEAAGKCLKLLENK